VAIAFAAGAGVGYRSGVGDVAQLEKTLARMEWLQVMMPLRICEVRRVRET